jgi:hypothetical protein
MAEFLIQSETLDDIANAINAKTGGSSAMTPAEMVTAIGNIPTGGGGGEAYELHSVQITLASSTSMVSILNTYIKECSSWRIYPTDAENTSLNTIAIGTAFINGGGVLSPPIMPAATTATGVTVGSNIPSYYVNDQTYKSIRQRGSISGKAAGSYQLDFYGVAL